MSMYLHCWKPLSTSFVLPCTHFQAILPALFSALSTPRFVFFFSLSYRLSIPWSEFCQGQTIWTGLVIVLLLEVAWITQPPCIRGRLLFLYLSSPQRLQYLGTVP
jgi:hypothetical protein